MLNFSGKVIAIVLPKDDTTSFVLSYFILVLESQTNVVQTLEKTFATKRIDLEAEPQTIIIRDPLPLEIHSHFITRRCRRPHKDFVDLFLRKHNRQHSVFEAVVVEDIGERRRDDRAEPVIKQRPRRMLP